jgi:ABC-type bacteriocin/lantibiotic exporter with double-glycine peptidase domain
MVKTRIPEILKAAQQASVDAEIQLFDKKYETLVGEEA